MHVEAMEYVAAFARPARFDRVVEFGSRDVNGSVRPLFDCREYVGVDIAPGPAVDVVADAALYRGEPADVVVCCEVLEHAANVNGIVASARANLRDGGHLVVTCATDPRAPHSAVDGGTLRPGEYYGNVDPDDLARWCERHGFVVITYVAYRDRGDLYLSAVAR